MQGQGPPGPCTEARDTWWVRVSQRGLPGRRATVWRLRPHVRLFPQPWELAGREAGLTGWAPPGVSAPVLAWPALRVCLCPRRLLLQEQEATLRTSHTGLLNDLLLPYHLSKDPISKYRPILRSWGQRFKTRIWGAQFRTAVGQENIPALRDPGGSRLPSLGSLHTLHPLRPTRLPRSQSADGPRSLPSLLFLSVPGLPPLPSPGPHISLHPTPPHGNARISHNRWTPYSPG